MRSLDYDLVASAYERRYETNRFDELEGTLKQFLSGGEVAEVGCGTGHWLRVASEMAGVNLVAGLDLSFRMLEQARAQAPRALLARGTAHELPWADASFDRVFCINALHHFSRRPEFLLECARVLREDGEFLTVGLDPHAGMDRMWIYDYFPTVLEQSRARFAPTARIRDELLAAGFQDAVTSVAQHEISELSFDDANEKGMLDRRSSSLLMLMSDAEWEQGIARIRRERPRLHADLRLYATTARRDAITNTRC